MRQNVKPRHRAIDNSSDAWPMERTEPRERKIGKKSEKRGRNIATIVPSWKTPLTAAARLGSGTDRPDLRSAIGALTSGSNDRTE